MFKKLFGGQKDTYFLEINENKQEKQTTAETEKPAKPVEEKKAEPVKAKKAQKTSTKSDANGKQTAPAPASKPVVSAPEDIIKTAIAKSSSNGKADAQDAQFATKYVMLPTMSRRRPGPSLNMFKDMARQAKVPRR